MKTISNIGQNVNVIQKTADPNNSSKRWFTDRKIKVAAAIAFTLLVTALVAGTAGWGAIALGAPVLVTVCVIGVAFGIGVALGYAPSVFLDYKNFFHDYQDPKVREKILKKIQNHNFSYFTNHFFFGQLRRNGIITKEQEKRVRALQKKKKELKKKYGSFAKEYDRREKWAEDRYLGTDQPVDYDYDAYYRASGRYDITKYHSPSGLGGGIKEIPRLENFATRWDRIGGHHNRGTYNQDLKETKNLYGAKANLFKHGVREIENEFKNFFIVKT